MKTKAANKLIIEEMEKIKLLSADQQLSKIEEIKTKYNISSERQNIQAGSQSTKGKYKKKTNIQIKLNEQHDNGKIENNTSVYSPPLNTNRRDTNDLYDKSTTEIMSELLSQSANE